MHDDQHGTAIVALAGLLNALKIVKKDIRTAKIVVNGAGAAGTAISKLLVSYGRRMSSPLTQKALFLREGKTLRITNWASPVPLTRQRSAANLLR